MATLRLDPLITDVSDDLRDAWLEIAEWLREQNAPEDLARRVADGLGDASVIGLEDAAARFAADVHDAYVESGQETSHWLDALVAAALLTFDATNERAAAWAAQNVRDVRAALVGDAQAATRAIIADGMRANRSIETIAHDVRGGLGITEAQARWVMSVRTALEAGDYTHLLERELRDGRADRTLEQALRDGTVLSRSQIDSMVQRYELGVLRFRADNLGFFEGSFAVHSGAIEALEQATGNGAVQVGRLKQRWRSKRDHLVRDTHRVLDGQTRELGKPFESSSGALLRYPRDPRAPASETRHCRCKLELVFN